MRPVHIPVDSHLLWGVLAAPPAPRGVVVFAHTSQSCRHSRPDNYVASILRKHGFATLLFDLVVGEEVERGACFDAQLLATRMIGATDWVSRDIVPAPSIGYFGTGMGGAAALIAAASQGERVGAIVCRSARTDLAKFALPDVRSPTLFLAGSDEPSLLELNRAACEELSPPTALERIPGSGRGSAEPKLLDQIAQAASKWYESHLGAPGAEEPTLRAR